MLISNFQLINKFVSSQIDGRLEGLEHLAESFFGPSGYFPQKNIAKMLREKRSLSHNKVEDMDKKVS